MEYIHMQLISNYIYNNSANSFNTYFCKIY